MTNELITWFCKNSNGIIVGIITTIVVQLPFGIYSKYQNWLKKPNPIIEVHEVDDSSIRFNLTQYRKKKHKIDYLYFKIDIPGRLNPNYKIDKGLVGDVKIESSLLCGIGEITTAETVFIQLKDIQTEGWAHITLNYTPTYSNKTTDIPNKPQFLDLHNISKVRYYWNISGHTKGDEFYFSVADLNYIKEDNNRLINSQLSFLKTSEDVINYNDKRKNW